LACGPKNGKNGKNANEEKKTSIVEKTLPDGLILQEVDLNDDGRAEIFNYYRERTDAPRLLVRKDADLNRDGNIDIKSWFDDFGLLEMEEMDGDFDGQIDMWDHYQDTDGDKSPERVSSEIDTDYDGQPDVFTYFRNGKVIRKERDTNGDNRIDQWEKYDENGNVIKSGRDTNFDGIVDERDA
jgi:antitoxin component YwqK of YwqJK toxin-antitoxin module